MNNLILRSLLVLLLTSLLLGLPETNSSSIIFHHKMGGKCLFLISPEFMRCNTKYNQNLLKVQHTIDKYSYTYEEQQSAYNKVACCQYWDFIECVQHSARQKCKEVRDMENYFEFLGSAVPLSICRNDYPKGSFKCKFPVWAIIAIAVASVVLIAVAVLVFMCIRGR